jgi:hypothetical protein
MAANPKKSETIEVRLSLADKTAFMARCRAGERTASDAIRLFIASEIKPQPRRLPHWRMIAAGAVGAVLGTGVAAPSLAHAASYSRPTFEQLDHNHDGVISYAEYRAR